MNVLRIGSRGSQLALIQTEKVVNRLKDFGYDSRVVPIATEGDIKTGELALIGGKGLFVNEIERAMLNGRVELAVHSMKDMPARIPSSFYLNCFMERDDPRDVLLLPDLSPETEIVSNVSSLCLGQRYLSDNSKKVGESHEMERSVFDADSNVVNSLASDEFFSSDEISKSRFILGDIQAENLREALKPLPEGARVGTSSIRRKLLLKKARPDLEILPIRGNVPTRIKKMKTGQFDAIVLACSSLSRLGYDINPIGIKMINLSVKSMIPAVGQGTIAVECLLAEENHISILDRICDPKNFIISNAERGFIKKIDGECLTPTGCYAWICERGLLKVYGVLADASSGRFRYACLSSEKTDVKSAIELGEDLAIELMNNL